MNYMSMARLRYALVLFVVAIVAVATHPAVAEPKRLLDPCVTAKLHCNATEIEVTNLTELIKQQNEVIKQWKSNIEQLSNASYFNQDPTELARCEENLRKDEARLATYQGMLMKKQELLDGCRAQKSKACPLRPRL